MAKRWHRVVVDGFARFRASDSKAYVSYNVAKDSWSSKLLPGNLPVEQLEKAPKSIRVSGEAWGVKVTRSYLEGEQPVVATLAFRGRDAWKQWSEGGLVDVAADPTVVSFDSHAYRDLAKANENLAHYQKALAKKAATGNTENWSYSFNEVALVNLQ